MCGEGAGDSSLDPELARAAAREPSRWGVGLTNPDRPRSKIWNVYIDPCLCMMVAVGESAMDILSYGPF